MDRNQHPRRDRLIQDARHDTYRARGKRPEAEACGDCGAEMRRGRWRWATRPLGLPGKPCPACQRIRDGYPAGEVVIEGGFFDANREEISNLARNIEAREKAEHPLVRIMDWRTTPDGVVITTTDEHLARAIGNALHHAYAGSLDLRYAPGEKFARVHWRRESEVLRGAR